MMSDFNLTNEVYGTDAGVVGPRFLDHPERQELIHKCRKLLSLTGWEALTALDLACVEQVAQDVEMATEEDMNIVNDIYEQRERESLLNGKTWEDAL
jgi:hypothetical protein